MFVAVTVFNKGACFSWAVTPWKSVRHDSTVGIATRGLVDMLHRQQQFESGRRQGLTIVETFPADPGGRAA
jgi:hypothetical protein